MLWPERLLPELVPGQLSQAKHRGREGKGGSPWCKHLMCTKLFVSPTCAVTSWECGSRSLSRFATEGNEAHAKPRVPELECVRSQDLLRFPQITFYWMEITAQPFQKVGQSGGIFGKAGLFPPKALNLQLPFATYFSIFSLDQTIKQQEVLVTLWLNRTGNGLVVSVSS